VRAVVADPRREVVKRLAGVRPFDRCGLALGVTGVLTQIVPGVVGVSGVATAVGLIPRDFSNENEINRINNSNSLILHGLVLGAVYNF
jgi:uncharacterized membrane protein YuzA (DUF378 family)